MHIVHGDLFAQFDAGQSIAITTNGVINSRGRVVMGRGCALQAATRWPWVPHLLAEKVRKEGNMPVLIMPRLYSFPVKHHWYDAADLELIRRSAQRLSSLWDLTGMTERLYIPRPGCGNGRLPWKAVRAVLEDVLGGCDWAYVITNEEV